MANDGTHTTRKAPSQCDRILQVLADRQKHTVTEIHQAVGPCRLNSRVAELRRRLRPDGLTIVCEHIAGETGPGSYLYAVVPLESGAAVSLPAASAPDSSGTAAAPTPRDVPGADGLGVAQLQLAGVA